MLRKEHNFYPLAMIVLSFFLFVTEYVVQTRAYASEEDIMPSEESELSIDLTDEPLLRIEDIRINSIKKEEDLLFINDKCFVITQTTIIRDIEGNKRSFKDLSTNQIIDVTYRVLPRSEGNPQGPGQRLLVEIRINKRQEKIGARH